MFITVRMNIQLFKYELKWQSISDLSPIMLSTSFSDFLSLITIDYNYCILDQYILIGNERQLVQC